LMRVRDVVLTVNREYIKSAAQADEYRTEPPFKLQGSYRNMNRMAERVLAVMNDAELESLIVSSYESDAQTLTTGTEANLLKFKELLDKLTPAERDRWEHIKRAFVQTVKLKGVGTEDKFGQAIVQLSTFSDGLEAIRRAVADGVTRLTERDGDEAERPLRLAPEVEQQAADLVGQVRELRGGLERIGEALAGTQAGPAELLERLVDELRQISAAAGRRGLPVVVREDMSDAEGGESDSAEGPGRPAGPADDQRITVVNKLPRTVMNVLERQFELMQNWLAPLLATATAQTAELQQLRQSLEACLRDYEALVGRLGEARGRRPRGGGRNP
ncbi:MAG: hypothetical protein ACRDJ9_35500, partial [Dehalococcoidia bacterium]